MMKISRYISFLLLLPAILFTACEDIIPYDPVIIGEGEATMSAELQFHPLEPALESRTGGNAVDEINQLWMVIYKVNAAGEETGWYDKIKIYHATASGVYKLPDSDFEINQTGNSKDPDDAEKVTPKEDDPTNIGPSGQKTPRATFKMNKIPYGRYKMFAVANVDLTDVDCSTIAALRGKRFDWNEDVSLDNQMFGYFTLTGAGNETALGDAPILTVNQPTVSLHSWIRRLVSKVTVSFDASGLKENVRIYIKSVTIHDIPMSCPLGETNTPTSTDSLIPDGESFLYYNEGEGDNSQHEKWKIVLSKGSGPKGEVNHTEGDNALYFFENMQGDFKGFEHMNKTQDKDSVGTPIDKSEDGPDFKDKRPYGTYIEVEAYYDSRNKDKISQGPIKYRFMLGKNTTYNYNAERNYHYKLTLKFRGWANEADWHISYKEHVRTLLTPEPYYISYLYGQQMDFPARVLLNSTDAPADFQIKAEIVENNWWPWDLDDGNGKGARPAEFIGEGTNIDGFAWNKPAFDQVYKYEPYDPKNTTYDYPYGDKGSNYVGFLSLKYSDAEIIGTNSQITGAGLTLDQHGYGGSADSYLRSYYKNNDLAVNTYTLNDGEIATYDLDDNSVSVKIPMYTRNKEMVPDTDFTGNNPFNSYYRYAKVRFTLWHRGSDGKWGQISFLNEDGKEESERVATIYQVPRIENPKAIYRAHNNTKPFNVKLMILPDAGTSAYQAFKSDGPWRASIMCQTESFIMLTGNGKTVTDKNQYIEGVTDTEIEFTYQPTGEIADDKTRCGIIKVEYHDYNCVHLIFVRQGYHDGVKLGRAMWSCYNVYSVRCGTDLNTLAPVENSPNKKSGDAYVALTKNPLSIGSFLKRCQYNYTILERNNKDYGWLIKLGPLETTYIDADNVVQTRTKRKNGDQDVDIEWKDIQGYGWWNFGADANRYNYAWADTWYPVADDYEKSDTPFAVPTAEDYQSLLTCSFGYGIVYADGANNTVESFDDANGFIDDNNDGIDDYTSSDAASSSRGVRACVVYDSDTGNNILFPLGATGQGRRARGGGFLFTPVTGQNPFPTDPGAGTLSYGGMRGVLYGDSNMHRPLTYNLYRSPGALYWVYKPVLSDGKPNYAAWDINYFTIRFQPHDTGSLGGWKNNNKETCNATSCSDAMPIKLIYKPKTN